MSDPQIIRENQYRTTLNVDGTDLGVWDEVDGGKISASGDKYPPGGMAAEIPMGGPKKVDNLTLSRGIMKNRDEDVEAFLSPRVGNAKSGRCTVTKTMLDGDGIAFGTPKVSTGVLDSLTPPKHDSKSQSESRIGIEIALDGLKN